MKIGITGGIGSGKSTVTKYLVKKGYEVIDCDKLARQVVEKGSPALSEIVQAFGSDILDEEGNLNRSATAELVFHDDSKREILNSITHRAIYDIIDRKVSERPDGSYFIDAPLLFESGMEKDLDVVWLVSCRDDVRIKRIEQRDGMAEDMIQARIASQMDEEEKKMKAGEILDNSGTREELYDQVERLLEKYL